MKKIVKLSFLAVVAAFILSACAPKEFDDYTLGKYEVITENMLTFAMTQGNGEWTYNYSVTGVDPFKTPYSVEIYFGNGSMSKNMSGTYEYIEYAGTFNVECHIFTREGNMFVKPVQIVLVNDNPKVYTDDPTSLQFALTGGKDKIDGKQWFLGEWTAMRNPDNRDEVWWNFDDPDETGGNANAILDDIFTFIPNSVRPNGAFVHENHGNSFMNESLEALFPDGQSGSFVTEYYFPPTDATWKITVENGKTYLTVQGFFGYAASPEDLVETKYEVLSYSPTSIKLVRFGEWLGWYYELVSELKDDPESLQYVLTGGKDNLAGRTWTLKNGPSGIGPANGTWGEWWQFDNNPALFDDEFTFVPNFISPNGLYLVDNKGNSFLNEALGNEFPDGDTGGSFITVHYTPPTDATWEITDKDGKKWLTINKGFLGYAVTSDDLAKSEYEVMSFSLTEVGLKYYSPDGNAWYFFLQAPEPPADPLTGKESKTWVIDGYNTVTVEVKAALPSLSINGFMGLGAENSYGQGWWGAGAGDKSFANVGWTLYDWTITFTADGQLIITTEGEGYGRKKFDGQGFNSTKIDGDDMSFPYNGGTYTFTLNKSATPYPKLTLSGNAFLGYYCGTQEYEILYLSQTAMAVAVHNTGEGQDWVFIYKPMP